MSYERGQWYLICDSCGKKMKSGAAKKRWDGLIVCKDDWETDHPQKYIRVPSDPKPVAFNRPRPEDEFVVVCTRYTNQGIAGIGVVGCAIVGQNNGLPYNQYSYTGP